MKNKWHYLTNQFLNSTKNNFRKANILSNYHDAALKSAMDKNPLDTDYPIFYNRYHPLHEEFVGNYTSWIDSLGSQGGETLNLDQLFLNITPELRRWDATVQKEFDKKSPTYKKIFPLGHKAFTNGAIDLRIASVSALAKELNKYPVFADLKIEVENYSLSLNAARDTQGGAIETRRTSSAMVEISRRKVMTMQYANLGRLMDKFVSNTMLAAPFFNLRVLRDNEQSLFKGTLTPNEKKEILIHTFIATDKIRFKVIGEGSISFYLGSLAGNLDSTPFTISGNNEQAVEVTIFEVANYATHRFLTAVSNSNFELKFEVEIL